MAYRSLGRVFLLGRYEPGSDGAVRGDLHVASVQISGCFKGNIFATERVELGESATGEGNIVAPRVAMADGGTFNGSIDTTEKPGSRKT